MDVALLGTAAADAEELGSAARSFLRVYKPVALSPSPLSAVALSGVSLASCGAVALALAVAVRQAGLAGPHATDAAPQPPFSEFSSTHFSGRGEQGSLFSGEAGCAALHIEEVD